VSTEVTVSTTTEWQTLSTPPLTRARSKKETQEDTSTRRREKTRVEEEEINRHENGRARQREEREEVRAGRGGQRKSHARALASVRNTRTRSSADAPENTRERGERRLKPPTLPSLPSPPLPQHAQANQPTPTPSPKNPLRNWIPRSLWQSFLIITSASFLLSPSLAPSLQRSSSRQRGGRDTGEEMRRGKSSRSRAPGQTNLEMREEEVQSRARRQSRAWCVWWWRYSPSGKGAAPRSRCPAPSNAPSSSCVLVCMLLSID